MRNLDNFGNILQWTSFLFFIFRTLVVDNLIYFKIKKLDNKSKATAKIKRHNTLLVANPCSNALLRYNDSLFIGL